LQSRTGSKCANNEEGTLKHCRGLTLYFDELQNQGHDTIRQWLDPSVEFPKDRLKGIGCIEIKGAEGRAAEIALELIPIVAVIDTEYLILIEIYECTGKEKKDK
jgi:hypothetical protein